MPKNWITESSHFTLRPKLSRRHSLISKISSQQLFIPFKICANVNVSSWFGYSTYLYVSFGPSRLFTLLPSWCRLWTWLLILPNVWQLGTLSLKLKFLKLPQQNSFSLRWSALRLTQKSILFRAPMMEGGKESEWVTLIWINNCLPVNLWRLPSDLAKIGEPCKNARLQPA